MRRALIIITGSTVAGLAVVIGAGAAHGTQTAVEPAAIPMSVPALPGSGSHGVLGGWDWE
jgi:uncharacterized membrane protein YgdD (TMEM256/DUF423 family)